jgi:hypothetical protein
MADLVERVDGLALFVALGSEAYAGRVMERVVPGWAYQRVLADLARLGRIGELPGLLDPASYAVLWALETGRLGVAEAWLRQMSVSDLCEVVAEIVAAELPIAEVPRWLNAVSLRQHADGRIERVTEPLCGCLACQRPLRSGCRCKPLLCAGCHRYDLHCGCDK